MVFLLGSVKLRGASLTGLVKRNTEIKPAYLWPLFKGLQSPKQPGVPQQWQPPPPLNLTLCQNWSMLIMRWMKSLKKFSLNFILVFLSKLWLFLTCFWPDMAMRVKLFCCFQSLALYRDDIFAWIDVLIKNFNIILYFLTLLKMS